jgi:hypothetical protein
MLKVSKNQRVGDGDGPASLILKVAQEGRRFKSVPTNLQRWPWAG